MLAVSRQWPFVSWKSEAMGSHAIGWSAFTLALVCGSTFTPFAKALGTSLKPLSLLFISEALTLLFVGLSFGILPMLRGLLVRSRRELVALAVMGLSGGVVGPFLWFFGLEYTSAVNAAFFGKADLVFLLLLGSLFVGERVRHHQLLASGVILFGLVVIALHGFTDGIELHIGDGLIVASVFFYSLSSAIIRKELHSLPPQITILGRSIIALLTFFLLSPFVPQSFAGELAAFPQELVLLLVGFAFVSRFLNAFLFYEALERLPLTVITPVGTFDVILTSLVAYMLLGEPLQWYHAFGGIFIIAGNLMLQMLGVHTSDESEEQHAVERLAHRGT